VKSVLSKKLMNPTSPKSLLTMKKCWC